MYKSTTAEQDILAFIINSLTRIFTALEKLKDLEYFSLDTLPVASYFRHVLRDEMFDYLYFKGNKVTRWKG